MKCTLNCQLTSFPKVRVLKDWFRHFNDHKEFGNDGTLHLFSLMSLYSYANFRSNTQTISGWKFLESPGQRICKLGSLPRILRVVPKKFEVRVAGFGLTTKNTLTRMEYNRRI